MAGYSYPKRSVHSSWLVTITLKEVFTLCMTCYNYTSLHGWLQLLNEVFTLFMAGYSYTKGSVHSLHDWLQLH